MELRHLRYFVVVAEERHFTRAAERLGIGQPPLSLQIQRLEREIGAQLFRRLSRGVELTEAGELLFENARQVLALVDRTCADVQRLARGEMGHLRVGFAGATYFHSLVPAIIREYRGQHPDVTVSPEQSNTPSLVDGLLEGRVDVAFIRPPILSADELEVELLVKEDMVVVLPHTHPLARAGAPVPLNALAVETFILFPRTVGAGLYDAVTGACERAGFMPRLGQEAPQITSIVPMVGAGFGVSIVPRSTSQIRTDEVVYLPISGDAPTAPISLAWRRHDQSPVVRRFLTVTRRMAKDWRKAHR
ncbi:LysR substrate-binding domain-containing protein [Paraburkholderia silviterrae]|uniref:LysR family transcriptional regulator n=1 Tax=Paraburkholderia silviterrae TaxID=2528715 RepID=A0A4R5M6I5_9BURK|nr:LysR substrate-binding domain-containing protein [Paraburkholderia silviterrae]TDG21731.1 LysR family transcriptional regulator [Paraburkholderia silviterrae]